MISINIPVYNFEVPALVEELVKQGEKLDVPFEVRVYDDGSEEKIKSANKKIEGFNHVVYIELEKNLGRSAIRNKMGFDSNHAFLLFIDADSAVISDNYLAKFLAAAEKNCVLCGGTAYKKEKPAEHEKLLRWVYGTKREAVSAEIRNNSKGFIITSNNFWIEKSVFMKIHFRENITKYGHEDTLLGYDLFRNNIEIKHINNSVEHTGLESSEVFLQKTKVALENLFLIKHELLFDEPAFAEQVHFLNKYSQINRYLPRAILKLFYKLFNEAIQKHLLGQKPNLFFFDFYKVAYYSTLSG